MLTKKVYQYLRDLPRCKMMRSNSSLNARPQPTIGANRVHESTLDKGRADTKLDVSTKNPPRSYANRCQDLI